MANGGEVLCTAYLILLADVWSTKNLSLMNDGSLGLNADQPSFVTPICCRKLDNDRKP